MIFPVKYTMCLTIMGHKIIGKPSIFLFAAISRIVNIINSGELKIELFHNLFLFTVNENRGNIKLKYK